MPERAKTLKRLHAAALKEGREERFHADLQEGLDKGEISGADFSIGELFESFVSDGGEIVSQWRRNPESRMSLVESGVTTSTFSNITGQLLVNEVMQAYNDPAFVSDSLCSTVTTRLPKGEKVIGLSQIGNEAEAVGEGKPYPLVGFGEDWIETPETIKRGMICPLTRETIVADLTGQLMERARGVSQWIRYNKEIRVLQAALGITSLYNRRSRGVVASYGDDSGSHDFDNLAATNALVDWTDIENAWLLFDGMLDPNTGTPIQVTGGSMTLVVPSALKFTAERVLGSPDVRYGDGASNTTAYYSKNPVNGMGLTLVTSQLVKTVTSSASTWFMGDFKKAFRYMEVSPIAAVQAPTNSHDEFHRDIIDQWKVSEWGAAACFDPRFVVKSTA